MKFELLVRSSILLLCGLFLPASFSSASEFEIYEAEDAILSNIDLLTHHSGFNGQGYADFKGYGSFMTWAVEIPTTGTYQMAVRYASGSSRPLDLMIDGTKAGSFAFMETNSWRVWYTETFTIALQEGVHELTLLATQSRGPNIDRMTLEFSGGRNEIDNDDPDIVYLQPEDATRNNVAIKDNNQGFEGANGFADFGGNGASLLWTVDAPTTETYEITARYAAKNARPASLIMDGADMGDFAFAETFSWSMWETESKLVTLTQGSHSLMIRADESSGPNLDWVSIAAVFSAPVTAQQETPSPTKRPTTAPSDVPSGVPSMKPVTPTGSESFYQPEDAKSQSVVIRDIASGYDGNNGYADFGGFNAFLLWTVDAPISGYYEVRVRYSALSDRPTDLLVDGNKIGELDFDETNSWDVWTVETMEIYLTEGEHGLMLLTVTSGGPNLDWLSLKPLTSVPTPKLTNSPTRKPTPAPASPTGLPPSDFNEVTVIRSNSRLNRGEFVSSPSGAYKVGLTTSGTFVLQDRNSRTIWSAGVSGGYRLYMQGDGNLILRTSSGSSLWKARTYDNPGATFVLDDGGQMSVVSRSHGAVVWLDGVPRGRYTGPSSQDLTYPLRGTFYYPWYPETWTVGGKIAHFQPSLGYYSSSDPVVIESHIDSLDYAHVDVNIASWWGIETNLDRARLLLRMDRTIEKGSNMKWTIYYEDEMDHDYSVAQIRADLAYLKKWFAWHPAWAHINGKPVIFIWNESDCEVIQRWMAASNNEWYVITKLFGNYRNCPVQPDHWHQYGVGDGTLEYEGVSFTIGPGFWRADKSRPDKPRLTQPQWCSNVREMVQSGQPWQLVVSFNEAGEGTMVESSPTWATSTGYGFYLDCLNQHH